MTDLSLPARFYSTDETPDICRDLLRAGLPNLAEFITNLMGELEATNEMLEAETTRADDAEGRLGQRDDKLQKVETIRASLDRRLFKLPKDAATKEHRELLESISEALEFVRNM